MRGHTRVTSGDYLGSLWILNRDDSMRVPALSHPLLALGGTVLWGLIEFAALLRARLAQRGRFARLRG